MQDIRNMSSQRIWNTAQTAEQVSHPNKFRSEHSFISRKLNLLRDQTYNSKLINDDKLWQQMSKLFLSDSHQQHEYNHEIEYDHERDCKIDMNMNDVSMWMFIWVWMWIKYIYINIDMMWYGKECECNIHQI